MKTTKLKDSATSRWLSYRPEIKVVDCTIRDGGLMNNHHFTDQTVKLVYETCLAAGVDYMELGYKAGDFPVAEKAARECLSLPIFPELTDAQIQRVAEVIKDFFRK